MILLITDLFKITPNNSNINSVSETFNVIKFKICETKKDFINCFDLSKDKKLKFIKHYVKKISNNIKDFENKDKEQEDKDKLQNINKSSVILIDIDLIQKINKEIFFEKLNSIINNLNIIYIICSQNEINEKNNFQKEIILNTFEINQMKLKIFLKYIYYLIIPTLYAL